MLKFFARAFIFLFFGFIIIQYPKQIRASQQAFITLIREARPTPIILKKPTRNSLISPLPSLTVTPSPSPSPFPSLTPTRTPTPTVIKPTASPKPQITKVPTVSINRSEYILLQVNLYRKANGLSQVQSDPYTCDFAKLRAKEIVSTFNHDGFTQRMSDKSLPYPSYSEVTENIAMTSEYTQVITLWVNSQGHAENLRRDTPFACIGNEGNYYTYESWKP